MGLFDFIGEVAGELVKDATGIDVGKTINTIKEGGLEEAIYSMKDDVEGEAYARFRKFLSQLSNEEFERIDMDKLNEPQTKAYEDERKKRRL